MKRNCDNFNIFYAGTYKRLRGPYTSIYNFQVVLGIKKNNLIIYK